MKQTKLEAVAYGVIETFAPIGEEEVTPAISELIMTDDAGGLELPVYQKTVTLEYQELQYPRRVRCLVQVPRTERGFRAILAVRFVSTRKGADGKDSEYALFQQGIGSTEKLYLSDNDEPEWFRVIKADPIEEPACE